MAETLSLFEIPEFWEFPPDVRIATGGCVGSPPRPWRKTLAHAHTSRVGMGPANWICFRYAHYVLLRTEPNGPAVSPHLPSEILLHELAHVLTEEGHSETWERYFWNLREKYSRMRRAAPRVDPPRTDPVFEVVKPARRRRKTG